MRSIAPKMMSLVMLLTAATTASAATPTWTETYDVTCEGERHEVPVVCDTEGEIMEVDVWCEGRHSVHDYVCGEDPNKPDEPTLVEPESTVPDVRLGLTLEGAGGNSARPDGGSAARGLFGLRLEIPQAIAPWAGVEVALGAGIGYYPDHSDAMFLATFEAGFLWELVEDLSLFTGVRYTTESEFDESWGHLWQGSIRLGYNLSDRFQIAVGLRVGYGKWAKDEVRTEGDVESGNFIEFTDTTQHDGLAWDAGVTALWRFW